MGTKKNVIEIDLTSDDDESQQRARIMAHASTVLKERGQTQYESEKQQAAPGGAKRQRTQQENAAAATDANHAFPPALAHPMNDMLKALHQERQSRRPMQQEDGISAMDSRSGKEVGRRRKLEGMGQEQQTAGQAASGPGMVASSLAGSGSSAQGQPSTLTILTYNIWFAEDVALRERMQGLVSIINETQPDVLLFQEVTINMMQLFASEHEQLLQTYTFSMPPNDGYFTILAYKKQRVQPIQPLQRVPFPGTVMGRDVTALPLSVVGNPSAPPILVATSHLESPLGRAGNNIQPREKQLEDGFRVLTDRAEQMASWTLQGGRAPSMDIVWGGDMNWIPDHKAEPQLPKAWQDVWAVQRPGDKGATYDPQTNVMLKGVRYKPGRLDRFFARLNRWRVDSIQLVGTQPLPGVQAEHFNKQINVLVSDHYGVLLKLTWPGTTA